MIIVLKNGSSIHVDDRSTSSVLVTDNDALASMSRDSFSRVEFKSDDGIHVYGIYDDIFPSVVIGQDVYEWYNGTLTNVNDIPADATEEDEIEVSISIEERVNDLEIAVCELFDSMVEA